MRYVEFNPISGILIAFYETGDNLPLTNLLNITDLEFSNIASTTTSNWRVINGALTEVGPSFGKTLQNEKEDYNKKLDYVALTIRTKYITRDMDDIYREKADQAVEYVAANYPVDTTNYPFIQAEANAIGGTPQQAADSIITARQQWMTKMVDIEEERRRGKVNINAAITVVDVENAYNSAIAALQLL